MEKVKPSRKSKSAGNDAETIINLYREFILNEGKQPPSVYKFCRENKMKEEDFYTYFTSFDSVERTIWKNYVTTTIKRIEADDAYFNFSVREKILVFYFTLVEVLKQDRSYAIYQMKSWKNMASLPEYLRNFKSAFEEWINPIINEGKITGEISRRPYLDQRYDLLFWVHLQFIIHFWLHDDSANFERTDAAIEKSVNLAFELIGKGVLESALDFGKFLYQTAKV